MKRGWLGWGLALSFMAWLIVTMPLNLALRWLAADMPGLSYRAAAGTVWQGRIGALGFRSIDFGQAEVALSPWRLLSGRFSVALSLDGGAVAGEAVMQRGFLGGTWVRDMRLRADMARLPTLLPMNGAMTAGAARVGFDRSGRCVADDGAVRASGVALAAGGQTWPVGGLAGRLICAGGDLAVDVDGDARDQMLQIRALLAADLSYRLGVKLGGVDPRMRPALELAGFEEDGGRYELVQMGAMVR